MFSKRKATLWNENLRVRIGMICIFQNGYYENKTGKNSNPDNNADWTYIGEVNKKGSLASRQAENLNQDDIDAWRLMLGIVGMDPDEFLEKIDYTDANGKILASMIQSVGLTEIIPATEHSIEDFALNSENYEFEVNDVIAIPDGNGIYSLFFYLGPDKLDKACYLPTGIANVTISMIEGLQAALDAKLNKPQIDGNFTIKRNGLDVTFEPLNETLESVVQRGNYTPKPIKFGDPASPYYFGINKNNFNIRFSKTDVESDAATGTSNIGIGVQTLLNLTSGSNNISIGGWAGRGLTTGTYNTMLGSVAGYSLSTGEYNLFVGAQSGRNSTTGNSNTFVGNEAGFGNTTGFKNVFVGTAVAYQSTTGNLNTLIGYKAGTGSVLGDRNTFIGSGAGQSTSGSNNVFIGVGAGGNDGAISNKLIIHSNPTLSGYSNTSEGAYSSFQQSTLSLALITGDFVERWFKLNGTFKVANGYMAEVGGNAAFTRIVMYNPTTGDFGKANILDLPFIPLSGTTAGKPVTGKIEFSVNGGGTIESGAAKLSLTDGYIQLVSGALKGFYINPGQTMLRHGNLKYINLSDEFDYIVISAEANGPGLVSPYYHGGQYTENSFIQKKYSDLQHSFTTSEKRTQGTWIDGKPVYQITLELTNIPRNGIVNLTGLVPGISRIVASDVFTEWPSLNLVFAGQVYRNDEVNVSINITPLELRIKNFITDVGYENIDRILLTIQYTKTEDHL